MKIIEQGPIGPAFHFSHDAFCARPVLDEDSLQFQGVVVSVKCKTCGFRVVVVGEVTGISEIKGADSGAPEA
jgi:DNA-directed RNA polymerase subunit RPC12/RpoP